MLQFKSWNSAEQYKIYMLKYNRLTYRQITEQMPELGKDQQKIVRALKRILLSYSWSFGLKNTVISCLCHDDEIELANRIEECATNMNCTKLPIITAIAKELKTIRNCMAIQHARIIGCPKIVESIELYLEQWAHLIAIKNGESIEEQRRNFCTTRKISSFLKNFIFFQMFNLNFYITLMKVLFLPINSSKSSFQKINDHLFP
ncbi:hypothetical protein TRFO_39847 [Tritrichomonas foetus]|uniref:Uncharacterized protein n=1 Tax=Tritrichomonas foetus TaxID=1144522 RepID=A0A1J4J3L7_9EUKA|nr:hypothetical protein TRFO_39847 [Tritrichomonas foetus]|eukprot:OHS93954.1 hypothetical protein TRFO_39847 [Tritrichomonas foetus]